MRSIIADIHELLKHESKIMDNKIDKLWQQIIQTLPDKLKDIANKSGFILVEDKSYKGDPFVRRMILTAACSSQELANFIENTGPYIVYVKD